MKNRIILNIKYEVRLKKNIKRIVHGSLTTYKKGTLIDTFSQPLWKKLNSKNFNDFSSLCICEGHGVYEYFSMEDVDFFRVSSKTIKTKKKVILK